MNFLQQFWGAVRVCSALLLAACGTLVLLPRKERFHESRACVQCDKLNCTVAEPDTGRKQTATSDE